MAQQYGPKIVTDGLVLSLDAADKNSYIGSGTTWSDLSGQGNNGTITGATFDTGSGGSINFDGSGDYITVDGHSTINFGIGNFTYEVWFKTTATSERGLICKYGSGDIWFAVHNDGFRCGIRDAGNDELNYYPGPDCNDGNWHHGVMVREGANLITYGDNGAGVVGTNANVGDTDSGGDTYIGVLTPGYWQFDGEIAIARIYNRNLTANEVAQNFNVQRDRFGV